jgi:hypothetical protein
LLHQLGGTVKSIEQRLAAGNNGVRRSLRHRQTGRPVESNALWKLLLPPASDFPGLEAEAHKLSAFPVNSTETGYYTRVGQLRMVLGMIEKDPKTGIGHI